MRILLFFCLLLAACSTGINPAKYNQPSLDRTHFDLCHGYSCTHQTAVGFSDKDWKKITALFRPAAKTPEDERKQIAKAIAMMEQIAGKQAGTEQDLGQAMMFKSNAYQLDCIDETINTTQYLKFIDSAGLLKWHTPDKPVHRGYFFNGWPHNTATIKETQTGKIFAVDAFYFDNGHEPAIVSKEQWLAGYRPPGIHR